jgi:signal transduction histidine kinase
MKTIYIFILLCLPLFSFGQSGRNASDYQIVVNGEKLLELNLADSALSYVNKILSTKKPDAFERRQAFFVKGKALVEKQEPDEAFIVLQKSLQSAIKYNDIRLILKSKHAICAALGSMYPPLIDSAKTYLVGTKAMAENLRDTVSLANYYLYTANLECLLGNYEKALLNHTYCEQLLDQTKLETMKAKNLVNKGNNALEIYTINEDAKYLKNSIDSYLKSINIFKALKDTINEAYLRNALAGSYLYTEDLDAAAEEVQQSIKLGLGLNDSKILLKGYYTLANYYEMNQNAVKAKEALENLKGYLEKSKDAAELAFIDEQFKEGEAKTSTALINSKIGIFNKQIENQRLARERLILVFILIIFFILSVSSVLIVRQKRKIHRKQIENLLQKQEIQYMKARQEGEEDSRHRIARQIHDGVGGYLVSAKWNLESALEELPLKETKVAARLNENLLMQEHSYRELRRVVYALEKEETFWWEDLQKSYRQVSGNSAAKVRFYTYNLDKRVSGNIGKEALLIVQEIITNALKYAKASEINVQINQIDDTLGIIIEDNGIGFDLTKVTKGVGFKSIEERCAKLGGSVSFESEKGHGATVFVDIPIDSKNMLKENPLLYAGTN